MAHPFVIGQRVVVTRRLGRSIVWQKQGTVVRDTKTLVIVDLDGVLTAKGLRFRKDSRASRYVLTPGYLDYDTILERAL